MSVTESEWLDSREVADRLAIPLAAVRRLAAAGRLGSRSVPGCRARYLATDVARLERESLRPATVASGESVGSGVAG